MVKPIDRRKVLARGAGAGALIWTAPVLLSVPAAAAASAPPPPPPPPLRNLLLNSSFEGGPLGLTAPSWTFV